MISGAEGLIREGVALYFEQLAQAIRLGNLNAVKLDWMGVGFPIDANVVLRQPIKYLNMTFVMQSEAKEEGFVVADGPSPPTPSSS